MASVIPTNPEGFRGEEGSLNTFGMTDSSVAVCRLGILEVEVHALCTLIPARLQIPRPLFG